MIHSKNPLVLYYIIILTFLIKFHIKLILNI